MKLWAAQTVSSIGARITREGLAWGAVTALGATPMQAGILAALVRGPAIVVGLTAGGIVDRSRRRPLLIAADVLRAIVLFSMPVAAWMHVLSIDQTYVVGALVGALSVFFDIADHAYLPSLIGRAQLLEGNAKLATTEGLAEIAGPALYGALFSLFAVPIAMTVNAGTYLFSAIMLGTIRGKEPPPAPREGEPPAHFFADFQAGLAAAMNDPAVRPLLLISAVSALFGSFFSALYILFAVRDLHLTAWMLGATVATGGVSAMFGAGLAGWFVRRFGIGPTYVISSIGASAGALFIPFAHGAPIVGMLMLMMAQLIGDSVGTVSEIAGRSLRQTLVAPSMMGRVGGAFAVAPGVTGVIGALLGGWLGGVIGAQAALFIACAGIVLAPVIGFFSPLMRLRDTVIADEDDA